MPDAPVLDYNSHDLSEHVGALIDAAQERAAVQTPARTYFGASNLGDPCARRLQYQYFDTPKDPDRHTPGRVLRVFFRGHQIERWMADWLRLAGFDVRTHDANGEQFGFALADGRVQGHADGVIVDGPATFDYPMLWECKGVGRKTFLALSRKRLARAQPVYATQVAMYQAYLQLHEHPALFTAINADDMRVYAERVVFDASLAQWASDRAVTLLRACDAGECLPRVARTPTHKECRSCAWQDRCWQVDDRSP